MAAEMHGVPQVSAKRPDLFDRKYKERNDKLI
jgi:hypothetical protein